MYIDTISRDTFATVAEQHMDTLNQARARVYWAHMTSLAEEQIRPIDGILEVLTIQTNPTLCLRARHDALYELVSSSFNNLSNHFLRGIQILDQDQWDTAYRQYTTRAIEALLTNLHN